jgi:predicted dinucleotide-binding enzyme
LNRVQTIAIIGGSEGLGSGLPIARRLPVIGIILGSCDQKKTAAAAFEMKSELICGADNLSAARQGFIIVIMAPSPTTMLLC